MLMLSVLLAAMAVSAQVNLNVIAWSASRRLTWDDFRGKPPGQLTGAQSAISYNRALGCRDGALHAEITAEFLPEQSYVAYRILGSGLASPAGLQHEQIHFDLAEVYARRVRKYFRELADPCPRTDDELDALAAKILREASARHQRYDVETQSGENGPRQALWAKTVVRELAELAAFAAPARQSAEKRSLNFQLRTTNSELGRNPSGFRSSKF